MKSYTIIATALLALGFISCTQEDSVASEEALFDFNNNPAVETTADTGNTDTPDDPPPNN